MKLTLLKEFFAGFLRTRHFARHFRRLALLESLGDSNVSRDVPPTLAQTLVAAAHDTASMKSNTNNRCAGGPTCGTATKIRLTCC